MEKEKEVKAMVFHSRIDAGLAATDKSVLEEYNFQPYSPYREKELMTMTMTMTTMMTKVLIANKDSLLTSNA